MKKRNVILAAAGIYIGIAGGTQSLYAAESGEQVVESYEMGQQETSESDIPPVQDNTEADMDMLSPQGKYSFGFGYRSGRRGLIRIRWRNRRG